MLKCFTNLRHLTLVQCHIEPWSEGAPLWDYRFAYHTLKTLSVVPARHYAQADVLNTLFFFRAVTIIKLELLDDNKEYNSPAPTGPVPPTHRAVAPARAALREMRVHTLYVNDRARPWGEEVVHRMCVAGACKALQLDHWGFSHAAAAGADRWAATLPALTGLVLSIGPPGYYKQGVPGMQKCEEHWYTALAGCSALRELRLVVRAYELGLPHVGTGLHYALSEVPAHLTRLVLQLDFGPSRKRGSVPTAVSVVRLFELLEEVPLQRFLQRFADLKTLDVVLASDREGDTASWCTEELCEQTWDVIFEKLPGIVKTPGMLHCTIRAD
ncbi:hypothetical protein PsYK624_106950 [Phanerochaete sordida]|uniref:Uncharacterized protein n=1 Tax=Phanerochaete sordida TaxID=48140 RepID=A0A9P3LGP4_9APHY|nr:hypothetical protein PsYK624_106950 [Phanerochaete sordida]